VVPAPLYERYFDVLGEDGGFRCRLTGRLHAVPDAFDPLFRRVVGVPRVYLLAENIQPQPGGDGEPFLATGAVTFEAALSDQVDAGRWEWEPVSDLHGAYVTFSPSQRESVREAAEWLAETYVEGLFGGRIITDFDEIVPRFPDAPFGLPRVTASKMDRASVDKIVGKTNASPDVSKLFAERADQLSLGARDFFISYTASDRQWAEWIAWRLEEADYTTVLQHWDFRPGRDWVHDMHTAISSARRTIAVLSPDYFQSVNGEAEWRAAYAQDPTGEAGRLLPIVVRKCEPQGLLLTRIWLNLVGLDEPTAREALVVGVSLCRAKPSGSPPYPGAESQPPQFPARP
jgi:hypothetical protein